MDWISRHNSQYLLEYFKSSPKAGVILPGIVGCGKTSLIFHLCEKLKEEGFDILAYDGDDVSFRTEVKNDGKYILNDIVSRNLKKPFVFVDEVQKEPHIFDAIKIAFDKAKALFIVSGSNPAYLKTEANDRLQRRAVTVPLLPISISEYALATGIISSFDQTFFNTLLWHKKDIEEIDLPKENLPDGIKQIVKQYLLLGGLPEALLAHDPIEALTAVKLVAERGITDTYKATHAIDDEIRKFLALRNSREFTYKGVQQSIRQSKRNVVDNVIDHLMNHGYLLKKRPYLDQEEFQRTTYLSSFSWIDPGLVTYYSGDHSPVDQELGFRLEGYVHGQLSQYLEKIPLKSSTYYYKPFSIKKANDSIIFKDGEIDFLVKIGKEISPIEVKLSWSRSEIDATLLERYIKEQKLPFGIVIYGGPPHRDLNKKIIYFPYWLL